MILIIPEIQILNGKCSYCIKSDNDMSDFYFHLSSYPNELCKLLRLENSKSIFINDIDSFQNDVHFQNFDAIIELAKTIDIPFQVLTNIQSYEECVYLINNRVRKIIFKEQIFSKPLLIKELIDEFSPYLFGFYIKANNNSYRDNNREINFSDIELIDFIMELGGNRVFYKNNDWYINKSGIEKDNVIEHCALHNIKVTLLQGVYDYRQLIKLNDLTKYSVDSIILGEAIYNNYFPCQNLWRISEAFDKSLDLKPMKH